MEKSFTPGPWGIVKLENANYWGIESENILAKHPTIVIYGRPHEEAGIRGENKDRMQANAYLVAAAPELLEALRWAIPYIERAYECAFPDMDENLSILHKAKAAINKALNKQEVDNG